MTLVDQSVDKAVFYLIAGRGRSGPGLGSAGFCVSGVAAALLAAPGCCRSGVSGFSLKELGETQKSSSKTMKKTG